MASEIELALEASKFFDKCIKKDQKLIQSKIDKLRDFNPKTGMSGVNRISGTDMSWRIRAGNYRLIFYVEEDNKKIYITKIANRNNVYRSKA